MVFQPTPFLDDSEEYIEIEKPKFKKRNKIRGNASVERFVVELMLKGIVAKEIQRLVKKELDVTVGYQTVRDYYENYFSDAKNEAVQTLKQSAQGSVDVDQAVYNATYDKKDSYREYLDAEFSRLAKKVEGYNQSIEATDDTGKRKIKHSERASIIRIVLDLEEKMRNIRKQMGEINEGPNGYVIKSQEVAKEVALTVMNIYKEFVPEDKKQEVRVKLKSALKKWDNI